jgi:hypothetical protein
MRRSHTAVIERGEPLSGEWATEPYEAGWASEAVVFARILDAPPGARIQARTQLSPDGIHWVDEGTALPALDSSQPLAFVRLREFGNWLRLAGTVTPEAAQARVLIYVALKE